LIYHLEKVLPNAPDRHSKSRKTSRKEKPPVRTRSFSTKLKRPPQDLVARKASAKDEIPRKKQKTEPTVSSSRKDEKPKSKKHKKKKHKSKKKKRGKRKHKGNSKQKRHGSKDTKRGRSAKGKSKDSSSHSKRIPEIKVSKVAKQKVEARQLPYEKPESVQTTLPAPDTSAAPGLIPPLPSISVVVPPPPDELHITEDNDVSVVELPKF
jgi:hypothetical protein